MVIVTGRSSTHIKSLADNVVRRLKKQAPKLLELKEEINPSGFSWMQEEL